MKPIVKIICCGVALAWMQGATAGEITVAEPTDAIVIELVAAPPDVAAAASAPVAQPDAQQATRVPIPANYDKVDRARIEKRIADRAARTRNRSQEAEKSAAERAVSAPK